MKLLIFFAPALVAAVISYALGPWAGRLAVRLGALDQPGPRKIHSRPIPRLGGLAVIASALAVGVGFHWLTPWKMSLLPPRLFSGLALGLLPIVAVSIRDDIKPLRPGPKFMAH